VRMATPQQELLEILDLRKLWSQHLHGRIITDNLLREMIRESNPSIVAIAMRETHAGYIASRCRWSDQLIRRAFIRFWQKVSGQSEPVAVEGASAPSSRIAKEPVTLNKKQACELLKISLRTLDNRMKSGAIKYSKIEGAKTGQQSVYFTHEGLGLPEPAPTPNPVIPLTVSHPVSKPEPVQEPDYPTGLSEIIWVEGPDSRDMGFHGDVDGISAEQRARAYRKKLAAQRRF
jgi:hypothetical protein